MLTLFYAPGTCSLASHIALEESGAAYETRRVDFAAGEQRGEGYLKVNPKGRVPALATDQGILTETVAILAYVAQSFPAAKLAPLSDPFHFAEAQAFNAYIASTVHVNHAHNRRGYRWADDPEALKAMASKVPQNMNDCFRLIEREMFKGPWVLGEHYSVCDPYLFTMETWFASDGVNPDDVPKLRDHHQRMLNRKAVQTVLEREKA
jgi:glutathione S-transferase